MASPCCIRLNVGGKLFLTTAETLRSLPDTRLGRLASDDSLADQPDVELFFDRNPKIINSLLDLYRTGELHLPKNLCARTMERELEFWQIPGELIRECCFRQFQEYKEDADITAEIDECLAFPYDSEEKCQKLSTLGKIWLMMERSRLNVASKIWGIVYFSMVSLSVFLYCLESVMSLRMATPLFQQDVVKRNRSVEQVISTMTLIDQYFVTVSVPWILTASELVLVFFLLEFLLRFLCCPVKRFFFQQARNRLDTFLLLHNLVARLVERLYVAEKLYFSPLVADVLAFFLSLTGLKLLRILYIVKDFDIIKILLLSAKASLKVLMLLAVCLLSLSTLYGTVLYLTELLTENFTFTTIPHAMWYAVVTMTTVGYGDVVPRGTLGRLLGTLCAFSGLIAVALPVAVVASKFSRYHDNLASRTQLRARLAFSKDRPEVLLLQKKEVEKGTVKDHQCYFRIPTKRKDSQDGSREGKTHTRS